MTTTTLTRRQAATTQASPERASLAVAVEALKAIDARLAELAVAEEMARNAVYDAQDAMERAEQAVAKHTKWDRVPGMAGVYREPILAEPAPQEFHSALAEAKEALAVARGKRDKLAEQHADLAEHRKYQFDSVRGAASNVICASSEYAALLAEVVDLQSRLADKSTALTWLIREKIVPTGSNDPAANAFARWCSLSALWGPLIMQAPGAQPWIDALAALQVDAETPLPAA